MPVYYPSCVVHLYVRFDDAFKVLEPVDQLSDFFDLQSAEAASTTTTLSETRKQEHETLGLRPLMLEAKSDGPDGLTGIMNRVPLSCTVELPAPRQAGTFSLEIPYRDLPIDPRLVASASAEVYMGAVDPSDFSTGMVEVEADGTRKSILNTLTADGGRREDLLLMVATVDSWHVAHTGSKSAVSMQGRDLRGIFLDTKVDGRAFKSLKLEKPINEVVQQIIDLHPWGKRFKPVELYKGDWGIPLVVPSPGGAGTTKSRKSVAGGASVLKPTGGDKLSFWDLITQYCALCGAIPFFQADRVVIREGKNYHQQLVVADGAAPFKGGARRVGPDGESFAVRKLLYGRDVMECSFERKFNGVKRPTIEVVSLDTSSKQRGAAKLIRVREPSDKAKAAGAKALGKAGKAQKTSTSPGGVGQEEILRIPVHGINDKDRLQAIAKAVRHEIGRGEMGGSVQTKNLSSFGTDPTSYASGNVDPDLLRLRPGDAVELSVDTRERESNAPLVSTYTDTRRATIRAQEADVAARFGGSQAARELARIIVAQSNGSIQQLKNIYRANNARFAFDRGSGINISFDFSDFIDVVADTDAPTPGGKDTTRKPARTTTSSKQPGADERAALGAARRKS